MNPVSNIDSQLLKQEVSLEFGGGESSSKILVLLPQWASLVAQKVKNPPAMWETWVPSLGWQDPLEKGTAAHSSTLAWRIPWTEEPGGLHTVHGVPKSRTRLSDSHFTCPLSP